MQTSSWPHSPGRLCLRDPPDSVGEMCNHFGRPCLCKIEEREEWAETRSGGKETQGYGDV